MDSPRASRPHMPGYGLRAADEGTGLLPWSWAEERLTASRNYWISSVWPSGIPHLMPVWGVWHEAGLWISSSRGSRKARNLFADPRCTIATEDAESPVIIQGQAELISDTPRLERMLALENAKYGTDYTMSMLDPEVNAVFRIRPGWAFGLQSADFTGSPTRWVFAAR